MNRTLSPQIRIVALVALAAAVALGAGMMFLSRQQGPTPDASVSAAPQVNRGGAAGAFAGGKVEAKHVASAPTASAFGGGKLERQQTPAKPTPAPRVVDSAVTQAVAAGLPRRIANAFAGKRVVVVSVFVPESQVDQVATREAAAGAAVAGAGFVRVDATRGPDAPVRALATSLGVVEAPAVLVFKRPGTLATRIGGFADHETVAQAALNAAS